MKKKKTSEKGEKIEGRKSGVCGEVLNRWHAVKRKDGEEGHRVDGRRSRLNWGDKGLEGLR